MRDPRRFRFTSHFSLGAPRQRVHEVLLDLEWYVAWWPQVRAVARLDDDHAFVVCRSRLPYHLDLVLSAERRDPHRLEVGIDGPIRGWARFDLEEAGPELTRVAFSQEVRARRPLFVAAAYVARPVLVWNHEQMMRGLERGLRERVQPSEATAAS